MHFDSFWQILMHLGTILEHVLYILVRFGTLWCNLAQFNGICCSQPAQAYARHMLDTRQTHTFVFVKVFVFGNVFVFVNGLFLLALLSLRMYFVFVNVFVFVNGFVFVNVFCLC